MVLLWSFSMVIHTRVLFVVVSLFCINAWAMEADYSAIAPDQFQLSQIVQEGTAEQKLKKLQTVANFLVFQAESYQSLKKMISVMEVLHELQPYRVIDAEGKKFLSAYRMSSDEDIGERYTQENRDGRIMNWLNVYLPEAQALALQVGHFLDDWKLKSGAKAHLLDRYLQHESENIRAVAGLVKHYVYSYQFAHLVFATPHVMHPFAQKMSENAMDADLINNFEFDPQTYQSVMRLSGMRDMMVSIMNPNIRTIL